MRQLPATEVQRNLGYLLSRVHAGARIMVRRYGAPVAVIERIQETEIDETVGADLNTDLHLAQVAPPGTTLVTATDLRDNWPARLTSVVKERAVLAISQNGRPPQVLMRPWDDEQPDDEHPDPLQS
ncbi:hypothetical protein AB0I28_32435 [Phytomonospora sp. NPDC050363]|uniref:type II toxin-antitoxin system Phd/YefM family antitoxin n=1 Tax=Phytomonospora sp. NPDC050363 TaxID=3155642 RepID=UPI003407960D